MTAQQHDNASRSVSVSSVSSVSSTINEAQQHVDAEYLVEHHSAEQHAADQHAVEHHAVEHHAAEHHAVEHHVEEHHVVEHHAVEHHAVEHHIVEGEAKIISRRGSGSSRSAEHVHDTVVINTRHAESSVTVEDPSRRRVVRKIERQAPRLIHHEEHIIEGEGKILKEFEYEEQVAVSYKALREDVVEHIVAVPVTQEEVTRDKLPVKVVEVEKRVPVRKVIEVPQVEVVEEVKHVPTPSGRVKKNIIYSPVKKVVPKERKVYIDRPVEKIVEVPEITYIDTEEVIETVEVQEYQDVIKVKEKKVPTIIEVPREVIEERDVVTDVEVLIPIGVEAHTHVQYTVPTIVEKRATRGYPVYVPRFIEVPTNAIQLTPSQRNTSKKLLSQMKELEHSVDGKVVSVCEVEKMGVAARDQQTCIQGHIDTTDIKTSILNQFGKDHHQESFASSTKHEHPEHAVNKDKNEGYYGHTTVMSGWNTLAYHQEVPVSHSRSVTATTHQVPAIHQPRSSYLIQNNEPVRSVSHSTGVVR